MNGRASRLARLGWLTTAMMAVVTVLAAGCDAPAAEPMRPMVLGGVAVDAATLETGRTLYARYCASCHGIDGSGNGAAAARLGGRPRDFRRANFLHASSDSDALPSHAELVRVIKDGVPEQGMPAWSGLQPNDLNAVAHYLKTFSPRWRDATAPEP